MVTAWYLVVTARYLVVTGGYCSLALGTTPIYFQYERTQYTYTFQQQQQFIVRKKHTVFKLIAGVTKEIPKPGFLTSCKFMFEVRRYVKYHYLPVPSDQLFMPFI